MSPESISAYLKYEAIHACVIGIEDCPIPVIVEFANGHETPVKKVYHVGGRAECIKILIDELPENPADLDEIHNLRGEVVDFSEQISGYKHRINELETSAETQEKELNSAENALEDFEYKTGFRTSARSLDARIQELADLVVELQGKNEELLIDNNSLACNIKELMAENEKLKSQLGV